MSEVQARNEEAYRLVGTPIYISGRGGYIVVEGGKVNTSQWDNPSKFVMEYVSNEAANGNEGAESSDERWIAFRLKDTNLYLSQNPYGNVAQAKTLNSISSLPILPDTAREIVDYAVGIENNVNEAIGDGGSGFDYRSMQIEAGPPGLLQRFTLEGGDLHQVGVKSVYGKYWRAPDWSNSVLQSPHQLGDESFSFSAGIC